MKLEEMTNFINNMKSMRQRGELTKEEHIRILTETNYAAPYWPTDENLVVIAQLKQKMDAAIAEARE